MPFPTRITINQSQSASVSRNGHRTSLYLTDLAHPIGTKFEKPRFPPIRGVASSTLILTTHNLVVLALSPGSAKMDRERELKIIRRAYAKQVAAAAGVGDPQVEAAFAAVAREDFLGPTLWSF